jgi:hypothetical protein
LADRIGAHRVTVADWVRGANKPTGLYLRALEALVSPPKKPREDQPEGENDQITNLGEGTMKKTSDEHNAKRSRAAFKAHKTRRRKAGDAYESVIGRKAAATKKRSLSMTAKKKKGGKHGSKTKTS